MTMFYDPLKRRGEYMYDKGFTIKAWLLVRVCYLPFLLANDWQMRRMFLTRSTRIPESRVPKGTKLTNSSRRSSKSKLAPIQVALMDDKMKN